jgi:hypothetical protein
MIETSSHVMLELLCHDWILRVTPPRAKLSAVFSTFKQPLFCGNRSEALYSDLQGCVPLTYVPFSTNLVDPASSHMLVSKIKPCKSKYKLIYTAKLRIAHYNSYNLHDDQLPNGYPW